MGHCIDSAARRTKQTSHRKIDAGTKEKNWSPGTTLHSSHIHTVQYVHHKHSIFLIFSSEFIAVKITSKYFIVMLVFKHVEVHIAYLTLKFSFCHVGYVSLQAA